MKSTTNERYISKTDNNTFEVRIPTLAVDGQTKVSKTYAKNVKTIEEAIEIRDTVVEVLKSSGMMKENQLKTIHSSVESAKNIAQSIIDSGGLPVPNRRKNNG